MSEENMQTAEEFEEAEVEVMEISLDEEEINEWVGKLEELRETKKQIQIEIDDENELIINYGENENSEEEIKND